MNVICRLRWCKNLNLSVDLNCFSTSILEASLLSVARICLCTSTRYCWGCEAYIVFFLLSAECGYQLMRNILLLAEPYGVLTLKLVLKIVQSIATFAFSHFLQIVQATVVRYISVIKTQRVFSRSFSIFCSFSCITVVTASLLFKTDTVFCL